MKTNSFFFLKIQILSCFVIGSHSQVGLLCSACLVFQLQHVSALCEAFHLESSSAAQSVAPVNCAMNSQPWESCAFTPMAFLDGGGSEGSRREGNTAVFIVNMCIF